MKDRQSFSHGLLYSVAPENFSTLHLHDEDGDDTFDWEEHEAELAGESFMLSVLNFLKKTAANLDLKKH